MLGQLPVPSIEHLATPAPPARAARRATSCSSRARPAAGSTSSTKARSRWSATAGCSDTLGPGDSFGEIALLHDVPRTATIRARTPLTVFELDPEAFLDAVGGFRQSSDAAYAVVAQRLADFRPAGITI